MERQPAVPLSEQAAEVWSPGPRGGRLPGLQGTRARVDSLQVAVRGAWVPVTCSSSWPRRVLLLLTEVCEVGWLPSAGGGKGVHLGLGHGGDRLEGRKRHLLVKRRTPVSSDEQ